MARSKTSTFATEVELKVASWQASVLDKRFNAARLIYNKCLTHYLKSAYRMRSSKDYRRYKGMRLAMRNLDEAAKAARGKEKKELQKLAAAKEKEREELFKSMKIHFGLREFDSEYLIKKDSLNWLGDHVGTKEAAAIRQDASKAFDKWMLSGFLDRRPRFRRFNEAKSVTSRTGGSIRWDATSRVVRWKRGGKDLRLSAIVDERDDVLMHGINSKVKFTRLVRREIRGRMRYFAQLVCEGSPYRKPSRKPAKGIVGLDIGTQTVAAVSENGSWLGVLCDGLARSDAERRRLQRKLDRSRRSTNHDCFDEKGRWIKGKKFVASKGYLKVKGRLAELARKEADHRKNLRGQDVARIIRLGDDIRFEKLGFRGFAKKAKFDPENPTKRRKRFGKSIGFRAPGGFVARLKQEALKWGVSVTEFDPRPHALSQTCICGNRKKKSLGKREHKCSECGVSAQRDLFSAYLARYVTTDGKTLHVDQSRKDWSDFCGSLESAWDQVNAVDAPGSLGLRYRLSKMSSNSPREAMACEAATSSEDVCGLQGERGENLDAPAITATVEQRFLWDDLDASTSEAKGSAVIGENSG